MEPLRLSISVLLLSFYCSHSTVEAWMEDVLQMPVSRGYLAKLCRGTISS